MTKSYWDILPYDLQIMINEHSAAIKIQERAFKIFYKNHGPKWKHIIKVPSLVYDLDYYCYLTGINDPWYDYSDNLEYSYYDSS